MIETFAQYLAALLLLIGSMFGLLAAIGLVRLPDLFARMHATSKAGALGCGLVFLAIALVAFDLPIAARALLGLVFILLTTPVSAHLLARAAIKTGYVPNKITITNELPQDDRRAP